MGRRKSNQKSTIDTQPSKNQESTLYLIPTTNQPTPSSTDPKPQVKHQKTSKKSSSTSNSNSSVGLNPISSTFYDLPVIYPDQSVSGHLYITPKASYPVSKTSDSDQVDDQQISNSRTTSDGRTIFITNLPRSATQDSLAELFAQTLHVPSSSLQVCIHEFHDSSRKNPSTVATTLFERDSQVSPLTTPGEQSNKAKDKKSKPIPALFESEFQKEITTSKFLTRKLIPTAHVRFENPEHLTKIMSLRPDNLPLKWPHTSSSNDWMTCYRARRALSRPSLASVKEHTDQWITAWESGKIPPLPQDEKPSSDEMVNVNHQPNADDQDDDGAGWTLVTRGGQHGRSATTISTQPGSKVRGADPYAQSSMADRDLQAGVKVMKRKFAKSFSQSDDPDQSAGKKRKGGHLNPKFYRSNPKDDKKTRIDEMRKRFAEDKSKMEKIRQSRKFKPY